MMMMSPAAASLMIPRGHRSFRGLGFGGWGRRLPSSSMATQAQLQTPLLMVSGSSASSPESRCLYKLNKDDRYNITNLERHHRDLTLPDISTDDYCLAGSSRGFLFFRPRSGGDIRAIDSLTGAHFRLPPVAYDPTDVPIGFTFASDYPNSVGPDPQRMRIILSPSLQTAILLRHTRSGKTGEFTRLPISSSSQWTPFYVDRPDLRGLNCHLHCGIKDCIFHKNRLYIVDMFNSIAAYDEDVFANRLCSGDSLKLEPSAICTYDEMPDSFSSVHLIESPDGDDIFCILRFYNLMDCRYSQTLRWLVYRLDDKDNVWERIRSIGDSALFMGQYGGMFFPIRGDNSCVLEPNSIYFADSLHVRPPKGLVDTGIYYLQDGFVEFFPVTDTGMIPNHSLPVWLPPAAC